MNSDCIFYLSKSWKHSFYMHNDNKQQINPYWLYIFIFPLVDWFVSQWEIDLYTLYSILKLGNMRREQAALNRNLMVRLFPNFTNWSCCNTFRLRIWKWIFWQFLLKMLNTNQLLESLFLGIKTRTNTKVCNVNWCSIYEQFF